MLMSAPRLLPQAATWQADRLWLGLLLASLATGCTLINLPGLVSPGVGNHVFIGGSEPTTSWTSTSSVSSDGTLHVQLGSVTPLVTLNLYLAHTVTQAGTYTSADDSVGADVTQGTALIGTTPATYLCGYRGQNKVGNLVVVATQLDRNGYCKGDFSGALVNSENTSIQVNGSFDVNIKP